MAQKLDLRTEREKECVKRRERICAEYRELTANRPEATVNRLFGFLAERHGMTPQGVRRIIVDAGLYTPGASRAARKQSGSAPRNQV